MANTRCYAASKSSAGETEDAFAKRVVADSQSTHDGTADFGTAFHHGAELVAKSLVVDRAELLSA